MAVDWKDPRLITWGELDPSTLDPRREPYQDPTEPVRVGDHPLFRYEEAKARRLVERCQELAGSQYGPADFRVSEDLGHMHTPVKGKCWNVQDYGFSVHSDPALPDNTVQLWDGD